MMGRFRALVVVSCAALGVGCGGPDCGEGTVDRDGVCVPAYPKVDCGDGTIAQDGICAPAYPKLECAEGTIEKDGTCVAAYPERTCGPSTVELDGHCVLDSNVGPCSAGTVLRGDSCVAAELEWVSLPFEAGRTVTVSQGFNGYFSHYSDSRYAVDFPVDEGTTVVAARGGMVWRVKEDSNSGCAEDTCASQGNYVIIDHGDATFGYYYHLQQNGALVAAGDQVCVGQPIGKSGNTGFSSGPHLHFGVEDLNGQTLPLVFAEVDATADGMAFAGGAFESKNAEPAECDQDTKPSLCPRDVFAYMGIVLDTDVPCSVAEFDHEYHVSGRTLVAGAKVLVGRWLTSTQDWSYTCLAADTAGGFSFPLSWAQGETTGYTYLMVAAADGDCNSYQGWHSAPFLVFR